MNFHLENSSYINDKNPYYTRIFESFRLPEFGQWFNDTNTTEVTDADFWRYSMLYGFNVFTSVQRVNVDAGVWASVKAFYVGEDQSWIIVVVPYSAFGSHESTKWKLDTPRYFKYQKCKHEFNGRSVGRCITEYTCKLCGFIHTVDSSD